jgi:hypothetical protein
MRKKGRTVPIRHYYLYRCKVEILSKQGIYWTWRKIYRYALPNLNYMNYIKNRFVLNVEQTVTIDVCRGVQYEDWKKSFHETTSAEYHEKLLSLEWQWLSFRVCLPSSNLSTLFLKEETFLSSYCTFPVRTHPCVKHFEDFLDHALN